MVPLSITFRTETGTTYVYDVCTGEILRVSDAVYQVVGDYHLLTSDEICEKHSELDEETVRGALLELDEAQKQGLLRDHTPQISAKVESAFCGGKVEESEPIRDFLRHRRRLLTLELTHRCNLACEYCLYGEHYQQTRYSSEKPLSLDTAKRAITDFLSHKTSETASIGFYGGEPLLEYDLLKEIVAFAEQLAATKSGMEVRFSITTNGTLLSDEKIHFLAAHDFCITISLDGNKQSHDRYRVFKRAKKSTEERRGSFDVIIRNMERFVELYPDYETRGIVLTLTATTDFSETEQFVSGWKPSFPVFAPNFVMPIQRPVDATGESHPLGVGECPSQAWACRDESCVRRAPRNEQLAEIPEFDQWTMERLAALASLLDGFVSKLCQSDSLPAALQSCDDFPISAELLKQEVEAIHQRTVVGGAAIGRTVTRLSCFPGASRTFCDGRGVVFPCERVEFGKLFEIGDATNDVDADKAYDFLVEMVRLGCDCGNCIVNQECKLCPAQLSESRESPGYPDFLALQGTCQRVASEPPFIVKLRTYAQIMEANPDVLDWLYPKPDGEAWGDWLSDVRVSFEKQEEVELPVEELEEWV